MAALIRTAVFPVAGRGTRMLPVTRTVSKEVLPVVDRPLMDYALREAAEAGIEHMVLVTNGPGSLVESCAKDITAEIGNCRISIAHQTGAAGLGDAILQAREYAGDEPFAVILPDDIVIAEPGCLSQLTAAHARTGGQMAAVEEVPLSQVSRYGIVSPGAEKDRLVEILAVVEKPDPKSAPSRLAITGRYILTPEIFEPLSAGARGSGGEVQLTDALSALIGRIPFHGFRFSGERHDCGDRTGFLMANVALGWDREDIGAAFRSRLRAFIKEHDGDGGRAS